MLDTVQGTFGMLKTFAKKKERKALVLEVNTLVQLNASVSECNNESKREAAVVVWLPKSGLGTLIHICNQRFDLEVSKQ